MRPCWGRNKELTQGAQTWMLLLAQPHNYQANIGAAWRLLVVAVLIVGLGSGMVVVMKVGL